MRIVVAFLVLLCINPVAFGHGMSEADQIRAAEGGFLEFTLLGARHMITGYDHLLFLFGVVFFLNKFKEVVKFVTAFTLGHSITLIAATFLGIQANYFLVDAVIALTVCYKGFDNVDGFKRYLGMQSPNLLAAVFVFGLIHGFGLSTRLQNLTIGEGWPLLGKIIAFNIGVELGQIAALAVILAVLAAWRRTESFTRFSLASNTGLILVGGLLFITQLHGYTHNADPSAFGFDEDGHEHAHEHAPAAASGNPELPPGWHIDPGETVPHTHDEDAALPPGWHIDPGETVPHRHDDEVQSSEEAHVHPGETEPHTHGDEANPSEEAHVHPGETEPHTHDAKPSEEAHVHPGETEPHTHGDEANPSEEAHVHPGELEPHTHDAKPSEEAHFHPGESQLHTHDDEAKPSGVSHTHPGESQPHTHDEAANPSEVSQQ